MTVWILVWSSARAGVTVDDPTPCLDPDRLENETRLLLGDRLTDALAIEVTVRDEGRELRTLTTVDDDGERLWQKELSATAGDCDALPEALALSLHQGLAAIPGWTFDEAPPKRPAWTADLATSLGGLRDLRFGFQLGADYPVHPQVDVWTEVRGRASSRVALGDGSATLVTLAFAAGADAHRSLGTSRLFAGLGVLGGPLWATGKGFDLNATAVAPRVALQARGGVQLATPLRFAATVELPVLRVQLVEEDGDQVIEAPVRIGVSVGIRVASQKKLDAK